MLHRIKVIDIELSQPPCTLTGLKGYTAVKGLVRLHGTPLGYVQFPVTNDSCSGTLIRQTILEQYSWPIMSHLLRYLLAAPPQVEELGVTDLLNATPMETNQSWPLVTVAVCTRDRTADLTLCLEALSRLDYASLEILVVDNAPTNDATRQLIEEGYPHVRYVCEPRPGLNWARNRAILEASGEIVAYTDDDVIVDDQWVKALAGVFAENPEVMAVTGLVVPYELETEAQFLFESYGGFGRGFERKWYQVNPGKSYHWWYHGSGQFGTGANMAYRRTLFEQIGYFDPALDVGTVTNGGGDLEMFFRVLKEGYTLVYEPRAIVRHRHRREYTKLQTQIANNGIGFYAYLVRSLQTYPEERLNFIRFGWWWFWWWSIRRMLISWVRPPRLPRDLIWVELIGSLIGLRRYQQAQQAAERITAQFGPTAPAIQRPPRSRTSNPREEPIAVRTIDLREPEISLPNVTDYMRVRIFITWADRPLGSFEIINGYRPLSAARLRDAAVDHLGLKLLGTDKYQGSLWSELVAGLSQHYLPAKPEPKLAAPEALPAHVPVSVVVATHDRPGDLRECLQGLVSQVSPRKIEVIIVDNNPASCLTPPVVAEFPGVVLINETRKGLSYARNRGIAVSQGEIIIATDDDVKIPPIWLERLVAPFSRADVMIVTGNTLPLELETSSQQLFERYGGLSRGFERFEVGAEWFESYRRHAVPTWELGATANAAFRATIFSDPEIGLLDEALGVGTPTGCSEDTYLFYKVLKTGYTLMYEPTAYLWHKHRRDKTALHRQIYGYSKGHVAYHLTTLIRHQDMRALFHIGFHMPRWHMQRLFWQLKNWLRGRKNEYPFWMTLIEIKGNLVGPWALWRSRRRVVREGLSQPYVPAAQRPAIPSESPFEPRHANLSLAGEQVL